MRRLRFRLLRVAGSCLVLVPLLLSVLSVGTVRSAPDPNFWVQKTSSGPGGYYSPMCVAPDGNIYMFSYYYNRDNQLRRYDPVNNSWVNVGPPLPGEGRAQCGIAATADGKIYVYGGRNGRIFDEMWRFDLATQQWALMKQTGTPRYGCAMAVATNGKLYVIGGIYETASGKRAYSDSIYEYDPVGNTWAYKSYVTSRAYCAAVGHPNGKVYVYGGYYEYMDNDFGVGPYMKAYDPASNTVTYYTNAPAIETYAHAMAVGGDGRIYVYGGYDPYYPGSNMRGPIGVFDPVAVSWSSMASIGGRAHHAMAPGSDGRVYLHGGYATWNQTWQYTPPYLAPSSPPSLTPGATAVTVGITLEGLYAGRLELQTSSDGSTWQTVAGWPVALIPGMSGAVPPAAYTHAGLTPNTRHRYRINRGWTGELVTGQAASCWTLANVPSPGSLSSTQTSVTASWGTNGNASGTEYLAELRDSAGSVLQSTGWVANKTGHTFSGLSPGTPYRVYVKARNGAGVETSWTYVGECWTVPATPAAPSGTVTPLAWSNSAGRGRVQLAWQPVSGATGYAVWVFDGYQYRRFDVGNVTSWDSQVERIYPSEAWLDAQEDNSVTGDPFYHNRGGEQLRDTPNKLYRKTAGTTYDDRNNYWFRVSAYNSGGESPYSAGAFMPTLPNRTDTRAPEGSVVLNGGAEYVNQTQVTVNLSVVDPPVPNYTSDTSDDASGLSQMRFSNDGSYWSAWEPYAASKQWTLLPIDGLKTVYVQVRDNAGNVGSFQDSIVLDTGAPSGSVVINSGAQYATAPRVQLSLSATDSLSGVSQMRFSNDGSTWSAWEAYATSRAWDLSSGDGTKTVYVQFRDRAGNVSPVATDTIVLDTVAPSANPQINGGAAYTNSPSVTVTLNGYDATSGLSEMMVSTRSDFAGVSWEGYQATKSLTLPSGDGTKTVYVKLRDRAGNVSGVFTDTIVLDTAPPSGSLRVLSRDGLSKTASQEVVLEISASDSLSGVRGIQLSNNGVAWTDEMPLASPVDWLLSPGAGTKTVYLKVWDRAGNSSLAFGEIVLVDDMLGPQVTFQVNGGATVVSQLLVDLGILAWDNFSRPEEMLMRFSNDGLHWSVWEPYAESKRGWDLSAPAYGGNAEQGTKRVYCQVVDGNANIGQAMAQVYYATSPISGFLESADGVAGTYAGSPCRYVQSNQVTVQLIATASEVQFSLDGVSWGPWEPYAASRRITLPKGDGPTVVSARFRDAEGAVSPVAEILFVLDTRAPQVTAKPLGGATVTKTGSVTLVVTASDKLPGPLEYRLDGGAWAALPADGRVTKSGLDPGTSGRLYTILVEVRDQAGNVGSTTVDIWSVP